MDTFVVLLLSGSHYFVDGTLLSWREAKTNCEQINSTLVVIYDSTENIKVKNLMPKRQSVWIGLHISPLWLWSETNSINRFMNWETGQPDNQKGNEMCAAVVARNGNWTDELCNAQYPSFCYGILKSKKTVVSMNFQTDANLENPDNSLALMQQLQAMLTKQGVTEFKLTWTKQPVKGSKKTIKDLY